MTTALTGIRILDLTTGPAAGIATMILADFGAEVLVVKRPGSDLFESHAAFPMWSRGKKCIELDLDNSEERDTFETLCNAADVLFCNWRSTALERKELHFDAVHERHPHLIFCHVSGFGSHGPRADYPGYEHVAAAVTGRMRLFERIVDRDGPVFSALQVGVHACAQNATAGTLAALLERGEDGEGRLVETSLLQGLLPYEQGAMLGVQFRDRFPDLFPPMVAPSTNEPPMPSLFYHPAQAKDGRWMQFGNLLPHLYDNFLRVTDLVDVLIDPDWDPEQMYLRDRDKHEAFRQRMLEQIQQRSSDEWMNELVSDGGVVGTVYETTQQALKNPDVIANGHVVERLDGGVQIGPVARLMKTPAEPGPDMESGIQYIEEWTTVASGRVSPKCGREKSLPLAGVKVVELATIIAAPLGASYLADMGADVIKVEQLGGDPYRGQGMGIGSARVNAGKKSISIDLKSDAGKEIVLKLLSDADVLIHNYRPGVPERLGIGYEQVVGVNPNIVYVQSNGYGPDGPGAHRPSTHPVPGAAMGGVMYQMREELPNEIQDFEGLCLWTRRLMRANEVNPDPNTAVVVATSSMLGLVARARTGKGQQILVDMFGANAYANHDDFLDYQDKPKRAMADRMMHGLSPCYRLYQTADEQWVFLALISKRERKKFNAILLGIGIQVPTIELLEENGAALEQALDIMFKQKDADSWENILAPKGIGCVRADRTTPSDYWLHDPQAVALNAAVPIDHPHWGEYKRHGAMVNFDGEYRPLKAPPMAGEHNKELLVSLGYEPDLADRLEASGILYRE